MTDAKMKFVTEVRKLKPRPGLEVEFYLRESYRFRAVGLALVVMGAPQSWAGLWV
jgi:hypothetical protein